MCVAVRKKLQLYFWKDREFHELQVKSTVPAVGRGWDGSWCCSWPTASCLELMRFSQTDALMQSPGSCSCPLLHNSTALPNIILSYNGSHLFQMYFHPVPG